MEQDITPFRCPKCNRLVTGICGFDDEGHVGTCGFVVDRFLYNRIMEEIPTQRKATDVHTV